MAEIIGTGGARREGMDGCQFCNGWGFLQYTAGGSTTNDECGCRLVWRLTKIVEQCERDGIRARRFQVEDIGELLLCIADGWTYRSATEPSSGSTEEG